MKRSTNYGDLVLTPAESKGRESHYKSIRVATERLRWCEKWGTEAEWRKAKARMMELESVRFSESEYQPLPLASEWTQFLGRRK